jgi:hypothetical protein
MDRIDLAQEGHTVGSCERSNETLDNIKSGEFLVWLRVLLPSQDWLSSMQLVTPSNGCLCSKFSVTFVCSQFVVHILL